MTRLLTANEAAAELGISVQLLKKQIAKGTGPAVTRLGSGHSRILVRADELDAWISRRTSSPPPAPQPRAA